MLDNADAVIIGMLALFIAIPTAVAVAIFRYDLYDVDRAILATTPYLVVIGGIPVVWRTHPPLPDWSPAVRRWSRRGSADFGSAGRHRDAAQGQRFTGVGVPWWPAGDDGIGDEPAQTANRHQTGTLWVGSMGSASAGNRDVPGGANLTGAGMASIPSRRLLAQLPIGRWRDVRF